MNEPSIVWSLKSASLSKSANFLDSDFLITEGNIIKLNVVISDELTIEYTLDGTNFYGLNSVLTQGDEGSYTYKFPVTAGDTFNLRIKEGTATTLLNLKADLWVEQ